MFDLEFKDEALAALRRLKAFDAKQILDAVESHLRIEPERTSTTRIKKLRGRQQATFRLRVDDYRIFYDVVENVVTVVAILHKDDTPMFYEKGQAQ